MRAPYEPVQCVGNGAVRRVSGLPDVLHVLRLREEAPMSVDCDGGESPSVWREGPKRAAIAHKCSACREGIRPGDLYHYTFYVFEGQGNTMRRCARCEVLYRALVKLHQKERPQVEDVEEPGVHPELECGHTFEQVFKRPPPPELARLAFLTPDEMQRELAKGMT